MLFSEKNKAKHKFFKIKKRLKDTLEGYLKKITNNKTKNKNKKTLR